MGSTKNFSCDFFHLFLQDILIPSMDSSRNFSKHSFSGSCFWSSCRDILKIFSAGYSSKDTFENICSGICIKISSERYPTSFCNNSNRFCQEIFLGIFTNVYPCVSSDIPKEILTAYFFVDCIRGSLTLNSVFTRLKKTFKKVKIGCLSIISLSISPRIFQEFPWLMPIIYANDFFK